VALQLDGHHPEVAGKGGQQSGEAALDRAERAVEQHQRRAVTMTLVVEIERTDVDVARGRRPHTRVR
jgi:hypothetical protein